MAKFLEAVLILSGMIIGVGMFGIPFSFARAGFWLGVVELAILAGVITLFHLLYGKIVLATQGAHRLPGYVRFYLGSRAGIISWASALFGISLTLLAYVLVGSFFLDNIFKVFWSGSNQIFWMGAVVMVGAAINLFSLKKEALVNGILTGVLIFFILGLIFFLLPQTATPNFTGFNPANLFIPYGVLLFALSGGVVIPEVIEVLGRNVKKAQSAIIIGTLLPALLYLFFALAVVGVSGAETSEDAISGLLAAGKNLIFWGSAIGFLAVFTSFVVLNSNFQSLLTLDLKISSKVSWFIVSLLPVALYFAGFKSFVAVIAAVGALAVGIDSALIVAAHFVLRRREGWLPRPASYLWRFLLYGMIAAGVVYELFNILWL
ncbi:MAG: hypothetical protein HYW89_02855 [Candidatus Sungiibacteriota bacterium]|uniref:Amino acid permease n=1 Tax=Candidatus Sungiibacteriota bacterium TaxID=2750080 RepID=A0A7T5RIX0_9BACT|nr:MAG: hypothetical protein HYW89_02855 [Candidatus Sungbacteria bacterium]